MNFKGYWFLLELATKFGMMNIGVTEELFTFNALYWIIKKPIKFVIIKR